MGVYGLPCNEALLIYVCSCSCKLERYFSNLCLQVQFIRTDSSILEPINSQWHMSSQSCEKPKVLLGGLHTPPLLVHAATETHKANLSEKLRQSHRTNHGGVVNHPATTIGSSKIGCIAWLAEAPPLGCPQAVLGVILGLIR